MSSYDSHAGPMASNAEVSGQLDVRLTTANCYPEAVCPVVIVYILPREERRHPTKYMERYSPEGDTTTHVYYMNNIMAHDSASLHHYINITNFIYIGEISGEPVD